MLNTRFIRPNLLGLWLAAALLAACAPQPGLTPVAPAVTSPVETAPAYPPPLTPSIESPGPAYPAPAASATPAQVPAEPTPTPDLLAYQRDAWQSISPDGRYAARIVVALPQLLDGTLVGDTYHVQASLVDFQDNSQQGVLLDEWRNWGMGYTTPRVLGWPADSAAFTWWKAACPMVAAGLSTKTYAGWRLAPAQSLRCRSILVSSISAGAVSVPGRSR
jgi:hypothetical protein